MLELSGARKITDIPMEALTKVSAFKKAAPPVTLRNVSKAQLRIMLEAWYLMVASGFVAI